MQASCIKGADERLRYIFRTVFREISFVNSNTINKLLHALKRQHMLSSFDR